MAKKRTHKKAKQLLTKELQLLKRFHAFNGQKVTITQLDRLCIAFDTAIPKAKSHVRLIKTILNKIAVAVYKNQTEKQIHLTISAPLLKRIEAVVLKPVVRSITLGSIDRSEMSLDGIADTYSDAEINALGIVEDSSLGRINKKSVYQQVNDLLLSQLDKGLIPWRQEWTVDNGGQFRNFKSNKPYTGINPWVIAARLKEHHCAFFATKHQIELAGGKLNKDATRFMVVYYGKSVVTETTKPTKGKPKGESFERLIRFLKEYQVYNLADTTGIDWKSKIIKLTPKQKIENCEKVYGLMPKRPVLNHGGSKAYYQPATDLVQMPPLKSFSKEQFYYSTLFHELIHSTGARKRLHRDLSGRFGNDKYAFEELIAEIGASYLCAHSGIILTTKKNSAAYLQSWLKAITKEAKENSTFFFKAASMSQKAANFILSKQLSDKKKERPGRNSKKEVTRVNNTPVVVPDRTKKASVQAAIKDIVSLAKNKGVSAMMAGMLYSDFNNNATIDYKDLSPIKFNVYEQAEFKHELIDSVDGVYHLTPGGETLLRAITGRLNTLRAKKQGNDMFPSLAGKGPKSQSDIIDTILKVWPSAQVVVFPAKKKDNPFTTSDKLVSGGTYTLPGEIGKLVPDLGETDCSITIKGDQGAGKSQLAWMFVDAYAEKGYRVAVVCPEMSGNSPVISKLRDKYVKPENQSKVLFTDKKMSVEDLKNLAGQFDALVVDSFTGLLDYKQEQFKQLADAIPTKPLIALMQSTTSGEIRGGNRPEFDAYINIEVVKVDNSFVNNYAFCSKNRFGATGDRFNISKRKIMKAAPGDNAKKSVAGSKRKINRKEKV
jgi:antirestriction protein ArdC